MLVELFDYGTSSLYIAIVIVSCNHIDQIRKLLHANTIDWPLIASTMYNRNIVNCFMNSDIKSNYYA